MKLTGEVSTPKVPQTPNGAMWKVLRGTRSRANLLTLRDLAHRQGYSAEGQFMTALADKLAALDSPTPKKKTQRTR